MYKLFSEQSDRSANTTSCPIDCQSLAKVKMIKSVKVVVRKVTNKESLKKDQIGESFGEKGLQERISKRRDQIGESCGDTSCQLVD